VLCSGVQHGENVDPVALCLRCISSFQQAYLEYLTCGLGPLPVLAVLRDVVAAAVALGKQLLVLYRETVATHVGRHSGVASACSDGGVDANCWM
jgi:hypothetical protein